MSEVDGDYTQARLKGAPVERSAAFCWSDTRAHRPSSNAREPLGAWVPDASVPPRRTRYFTLYLVPETRVAPD